MTLFAFLAYFIVAIWLSIIDIKTRLLPNIFLIPAIIAMHVFLITAAITQRNPTKLLQLSFGTALMFTVFLLLALIGRGSLGGGDVKLAAFIGPFVGYMGGYLAVIKTLLAIFIIGGVTALIVILFRKKPYGVIAFAPVMFIGSWFGLWSA